MSITNNRTSLSSVKVCDPIGIQVADGAIVTCNVRGTISFKVINDEGKSVAVTVENVHHDERFAANLLSWGILKDLGWELHSTKQESYLITKGKNKVALADKGRILLLKTDVFERVYRVAGPPVLESATDLLALHERFGHMGFDGLVAIIRNGTTLDLGELRMGEAALTEARAAVAACKACVMGKATRTPFGHNGIDHGTHPMEVLHMDTFAVSGGEKLEYGLTMSDPFSNARFFAHAASKDEIVGHIMAIVNACRHSLDSRCAGCMLTVGRSSSTRLSRSSARGTGLS